MVMEKGKQLISLSVEEDNNCYNYSLKLHSFQPFSA